MMLKVILYNSLGCAIDQRIAESEEKARDAAIELIAGLANLQEGDMIRVVINS